jgi:transcriptional regulator with XRE-family HTH domain
MDFYSLSDLAILEELGLRIRALRLRQNLSQEELASMCVLSLNTIKSLELGKGKLSSLIAVLRELEALDNLDNFIPDLKISPVQLAKRQGKTRLRASRRKKDDKKN